jgi:predicted extracellular nuclease/DNA/RNA endonuclease YhcR with UshA esterase domain
MRRTWFLFLIVFLSVFAVMGTVALTASANESGVTAVALQSHNAPSFTTLVEENFTYGATPGDLTTISGGVWVAHSGATVGPVQYVATGLSMPGYGSSGVGGAATIATTGSEDVNRSFTNQTSGVVYFAALVNISTARTGDYFFHVSDASTGFRARVFARNSDGVLQYGLSPSTGTGTYATDAFAYNTTYLVVVKYDANSGDSSLYVLDAVTSTEPATALVSLTGTAGQAVQRVAIRQGTNTPAATIDGVRVANTWEDVIGGPSGPSVVDTNPQDGDSNVPLDATIAITFSEAVTVTADWFDLTCTTTSPITGTTAPAGPAESYVVTPASLFDYDESCTFTVLADEVTNSDGLTLTADYPFTFTTESLVGDITFVYHDLEDVVQPGESVYLAGNFTGWVANIPLSANAASSVFSVTVSGMAADTYEYKYVVSDTLTIGEQWDWLNTSNHSLTVSGDATVNDYRNVTVGWANLQWPPATSTTMGVATENIYGKLYIQGVTNTPATAGRGLKAEVGYGSAPTPGSWAWFPMSFQGDDGPNNDEFFGVITPTMPGVFSYATRYDGNWGVGNPNADWTYASLNGIPFDIDQTGVLTVGFASVPIATARAGSNGEVFGLEGQVIATNGTWNNAPEWAFQDASGGIAAFFLADPPISLGDTVQMVATLGRFNNQEQMVVPLYYFDVVSAGPPVQPITYTTGQVASGASEGWLIEIEGVVSNMPTSCGTAYSVTLNDGSGAATVRIEAATGINLCSLGIQNGDMLGVVGFSTQFHASNPAIGFQVKPRSVADLRLFVDAPVVLGTIPANNAANVLTSTVVTIQFSEPVTVTADWYAIQCSISGDVAAGSAPAGPSASYTLTPDAPFAFGEMCHVTVFADQVTNDQDLNLLSDYRFSFTVGPVPAFGVCGDPAMPINFIQGDGLATPIFGATVVVEAVVVGSYQASGQFSGYFLQSLDDDADDDPMTSEGIFVFNTGTLVAPGDLVRVRGTATEFNNLTQIASVSNVAICATGQSVTPAEMTLPVDDMLEWEAVEGMLVNFSHDLVVTEHYNLGRFGEVMLSVNDRLWNPTNVVAPGPPALALQDLNNRSRIYLDDGRNVQNPDPVIYPDPKLTYTNTLRTGALVHNLTGVVDFRSNLYRIQPVGVVDFSETAERPYEIDEVGGTLRVASFNVLNYFTTLDTGAPICGPSQNMGCRGANTALEFERQRIKILNAILAMDADIVGLIEIENHVNDNAVIDLVAGLNALVGAGTYDYVATGVIGTDAIKLAFIYQPATVTPEGNYAILDSSVDPRFLDTRNRPVLIQTFKENATDEVVTVAVNHLKSKGSACDDIDDPDVGDGQGNCNLTRLAAMEALLDYLATDPTNSDSDRFLIIGDLNSYAMEDPIMALVDAGYADLLRQFYGDQAYSYVFDGQFGHLDHALASSGLLAQVTGATAWHINADEPRVLDYNTEFKTAGQIVEWFSPEPFRSSDHDPVIVGLDLTFVPPTVTILTPEDGAEFESVDGTAVTIPVVITTTDFIIPDDGHWHLWVDGAMVGPVLGYGTTVDLLPGVHTISAELRTPEHVSLGIIDTVTVTVTYTPPTPTVTILTPEDGAVFVSVNGTAVHIPVVITTTDFIIPDDGHWHLWVDGVMVGPVLAYDTMVHLLPGVHTISAELRTPEHVSLGIIDTVTVTVNVEYQLLLPLILNNAAGGEAEAAAPAPSVGWLTTLFGLPLLLVGLPLSRRRAG